ncbi:MAG: UpxY family transcription antiterminator [Candidatus Omnitrophica bacterium]|nr:UpxY family transcription antiterminator [Candidatus Omnitrophota bacterium]MDD5310551.1 UpxY family transcription antiterminator [Candidatus Omnitrophota bacterium]MDD5546023.1 UpxY family transcription antiterminator [Candidatus Omnitrophota bacterium]
MIAIAQNWYAVRTRSNYEFKVSYLLNKRSIKTFYPTILKWSRRKDRKIKVARPLFPGYLFVECAPTATDWLEVKKTEGVVNILGTKVAPLAIPVEQIDNVRKIVESGIDPLPHPYLNVGERIVVVDGPLRGAIGIFEKFNDKKGTLIISVDLLGRSLAAEVDNNVVERL